MARSYGGTETSSDHSFVVARIEVMWVRVYHQRMPNISQENFYRRQLTQNEKNRERYRYQIKKETESTEYVAAQKDNK